MISFLFWNLVSFSTLISCVGRLFYFGASPFIYLFSSPKRRFGGVITPYRPGITMVITPNQGTYVPPPGAKRIVPSGFSNTWNWLQIMGYPEPPPLMLELNGRLVRKYEDVFGCLHDWRGFKFGVPLAREENAWQILDAKIVAAISRRVVSLVSFTGENKRFLTCTGFIVRCPLKNGRTRNVIVTSASLVRTSDATDTIENMRIEVFLPPNQRLNGTLESYHSGYNIAIVTVKGLRKVDPVNVHQHYTEYFELPPESSLPRTVVAIGRDPEGVLCAAMGEPIPPGKDLDKPSTFGCKDLKLSTCKIKTVGIGGPLINLDNGCLVGLNFYDGRPGRTPYLPYHQICDVLRYVWDYGTDLSTRPVLRLDRSDENNKNRWPVPKPYWYHGVLEVNRSDPIPMIGRILH